jgi:hypothetical protein
MCIIIMCNIELINKICLYYTMIHGQASLYIISGTQKSLTWLIHPFPRALYSFFYIIELVLVLNIAEILLARC